MALPGSAPPPSNVPPPAGRKAPGPPKAAPPHEDADDPPARLLAQLEVLQSELARIEPDAPVLLPVGAGYSTEAGPAQVADALRSRVEAIAAQLRETGDEASRVANAAAAVNERLQGSQ